MTDDGIPAEAFEFYERLAADPTREFWAAHKGEYERWVREPLNRVAARFEPEFGPAHLYRPYRDVRFSKDKTPYKDHQGLLLEASNGLGYYVQVSAAGLMLAGGWYTSTPAQVARYRDAVLEGRGDEVERVLEAVNRSGLAVDGQRLKTRPRGIAADAPHLELLRYRTIYASRQWDPEAWMGTEGLYATLERNWSALRPMVDLLADVVGPADD